MSDLKTTPLDTNPLVFGEQEGFRSEAEARVYWDAMPNKYEFAFKYITSVDTNEVIAVVLVPCTREKYKTHQVFGEIK
jgi:hypothetical protein